MKKRKMNARSHLMMMMVMMICEIAAVKKKKEVLSHQDQMMRPRMVASGLIINLILAGQIYMNSNLERLEKQQSLASGNSRPNRGTC